MYFSHFFSPQRYILDFLQYFYWIINSYWQPHINLILHIIVSPCDSLTHYICDVLFCPSPCVLFLHSSVRTVKPAAVRIRLGEDGVGVGAARQPADRPPGHTGREGQRPSSAVPRQHWQGGRTAALRHLRVPVRGAAGAGGGGSGDGPSDGETRDVREQTGAEAQHQRALHAPHGLLRTAGGQPEGQHVYQQGPIRPRRLHVFDLIYTLVMKKTLKYVTVVFCFFQ